MSRRVVQFSLVLMLLLAAAVPLRVSADDAPSLEARVKAAFIFNFIQFTEWPEGTFAKADEPIVVGVFGATPVADVLRAVAASKLVNGRQVLIRQLHSADEAGECRVLIVTDQFAGDVDKILRDIKTRGILTIGDFEGFTDDGGVIRFFIEEGKERFEVNTLAAERAHLQISSKLLKLARIVRK